MLNQLSFLFSILTNDELLSKDSILSYMLSKRIRIYKVIWYILYHPAISFWKWYVGYSTFEIIRTYSSFERMDYFDKGPLRLTLCKFYQHMFCSKRKRQQRGPTRVPFSTSIHNAFTIKKWGSPSRLPDDVIEWRRSFSRFLNEWNL